MVRTEGPDGKLQDYSIAYTFGVEPLQQYLIAFPGGRLQALGIAWDSRPRAQGGQRWFHLYPGQAIDPKDPLHWTRLSQTWNHQCAECHSTDVKKNYDPQTRRYATTWQAMNVGCEACHGPGKAHRDWARGGGKGEDDGLAVHFDQRHGLHWKTDASSGKVHPDGTPDNSIEVESCARCHARRSLLSEDYRPGEPLTQTHRPALLSQGLYYPDGQIQDEVYVYGSFLQSKMYRAGVSCSDCHDPHTGKPRAAGNGVCLQCHEASRFDTPRHHHHPIGSKGAACAECHMPTRSYMVVDPRRDHSLRYPRPDLSVRLGTPNACNNCHRAQNAQWAARAIANWTQGKRSKGYQQYAEALYQGRRDGSGAAGLLNTLASDTEQPAIARASAVSLLGRYLGRETFPVVQQALTDKHVLVRMAALGSIEGLPGELRALLASDLLKDSQRAVRVEAGRLLADVPRKMLDSAALDAALKEYRNSQELNRDRPEALVNLANLARRQSQPDKARSYLREALELERDFTPAWINLADLERDAGRNNQAIDLLEQGLTVVPDSADLRYALGLARIRAGQHEAALPELRQAARLDSDNAHYVFVYAVALYSQNQRQGAIQVLESALKVHPSNRDILFTLLQYHRENGQLSRAKTLASRFVQTWPDDSRSKQLANLSVQAPIGHSE